MQVHENEIYTFDETKQILKISSSTMMRLIKRGLIRAAKVGKQYRIFGKEILRMLSPEIEDRVGKFYNKGRRWLHEEDAVVISGPSINPAAVAKKGVKNVHRLEK